MLKPKFRDIGKVCVALDGDIYSERDYDWITNQFPNTEQDLIPAECVGFSNNIFRQERGCSVFYSCLGPADAQGTQNPMQVFYRERHRKETADIHRPYRISRLLINEMSPETQYELVGPLAFYQARYAEEITGVHPDLAQTLPGLTEDLGQQINRFGYTYGETQDRSETDHYQELIELIVSYICNGQSVSLWQDYQTDSALLKPVDEPIFYQIAQRVWESLPSKSLQLLFSAAWGTEDAQNSYTLTCPSEGKFKGDSQVVGLIKDGHWTNYPGWLQTAGPGNTNYRNIDAVSQLHENHTFEPFIDFINWEIKQSGTHESFVGVPFQHESENKSRSLSGHLRDLLSVPSRPGEMFMIPRAFDECSEDPFAVFQDHLPDFNLYQVDLRLSALFANHQWEELYNIIDWSWYDSINRQQEKNYTSMLRNLKFIKEKEAYTKETMGLKYIHEGHDAIYERIGADHYFWCRDTAKIIPPLPNGPSTPLYEYIYVRAPYDSLTFEQYDYISNELLDKEHEECMHHIVEIRKQTGPWSEFKKKIRRVHEAKELSIIESARKALQSRLAQHRQIGSRRFGADYPSWTDESNININIDIRDGSNNSSIQNESGSEPAGGSREVYRPIPGGSASPRQSYRPESPKEYRVSNSQTKEGVLTFSKLLMIVAIAVIMFMLYMIYYNRTHFNIKPKASPTRQYQPAKSQKHQPAKSQKHQPTKSLRYDD